MLTGKMAFLATPCDFNNFKRGWKFNFFFRDYENLVQPLAMRTIIFTKFSSQNFFLDFFKVFHFFHFFTLETPFLTSYYKTKAYQPGNEMFDAYIHSLNHFTVVITYKNFQRHLNNLQNQSKSSYSVKLFHFFAFD